MCEQRGLDASKPLFVVDVFHVKYLLLIIGGAGVGVGVGVGAGAKINEVFRGLRMVIFLEK